MSSTLEALGPDSKAKVEEAMSAGLRVLQEMADLRDGLKDTVKAVAEEIGVKPAILGKAIRTAFKSSLEEEKVVHETVEEILTITGHA